MLKASKSLEYDLALKICDEILGDYEHTQISENLIEFPSSNSMAMLVISVMLALERFRSKNDRSCFAYLR